MTHLDEKRLHTIHIYQKYILIPMLIHITIYIYTYTHVYMYVCCMRL